MGLSIRGILRFLYAEFVRPMARTMMRNVEAGADVEFSAMATLHILIVLEIFLAGFVAVFLGVSDANMDPHTKAVFGPGMIVLIGVFGMALWLLTRGYFRLVRAITAWAILIATFSSVLLTGGFPSSPAAPSLMLAPAIFYCLYGGAMGGVSAASIVAMASAQWLAVDLFGLTLPNYVSGANVALNHALVLDMTLGIVVFIFVAFDRENVRLRAQRDAERAQLAALAHQDPLTGIANARYLNDRLEQACARVDRHGGALALLYLDFNGFKKINDDFGHLVGDLVLCKISHRLRQAIRREDIVARLGGDEFAILVEIVTSDDEVAQLTERVHRLVAEPVEIDGCVHSMTASVGRVIYPAEVGHRDKIIEQADRAMYRAKRLARMPGGLVLET